MLQAIKTSEDMPGNEEDMPGNETSKPRKICLGTSEDMPGNEDEVSQASALSLQTSLWQ